MHIVLSLRGTWLVGRMAIPKAKSVWQQLIPFDSDLAWVVRGEMDNAIHRINHYPLDIADLSDGLCYPAFEQLRADVLLAL